MNPDGDFEVYVISNWKSMCCVIYGWMSERVTVLQGRKMQDPRFTLKGGRIWKPAFVVPPRTMGY
jgi:hypothetical protein